MKEVKIIKKMVKMWSISDNSYFWFQFELAGTEIVGGYNVSMNFINLN